MPLSGLGDDSLEGLRAAFSGLSVGGPEGKEKEKEKQAVDMGAEEVDPGDGHEPSDEVPFAERLRLPCSTLSNNHYTPSHTSSYILTHNHTTYG